MKTIKLTVRRAWYGRHALSLCYNSQIGFYFLGHLMNFLIIIFLILNTSEADDMFTFYMYWVEVYEEEYHNNRPIVKEAIDCIHAHCTNFFICFHAKKHDTQVLKCILFLWQITPVSKNHNKKKKYQI